MNCPNSQILLLLVDVLSFCCWLYESFFWLYFVSMVALCSPGRVASFSWLPRISFCWLKCAPILLLTVVNIMYFAGCTVVTAHPLAGCSKDLFCWFLCHLFYRLATVCIRLLGVHQFACCSMCIAYNWLQYVFCWKCVCSFAGNNAYPYAGCSAHAFII